MSPCDRKKDLSSWDVLDEDATGTVGRKPDNNVFITKFLIIVQIKVIVMILLLVLALLNLISSHTCHGFCTMMHGLGS